MIRRITPNICDDCGALCSDNSLTYCHKKWLCINCFQKAQKESSVERKEQ